MALVSAVYMYVHGVSAVFSPLLSFVPCSLKIVRAVDAMTKMFPAVSHPPFHCIYIYVDLP